MKVAGDTAGDGNAQIIGSTIINSMLGKYLDMYGSFHKYVGRDEGTVIDEG